MARLGVSGRFVLGVLFPNRELSGRQVQKELLRMYDFELGTSLTYSTLARLKKLGLVELVGNPPRLYRLTPAGRDEVDDSDRDRKWKPLPGMAEGLA